jgi:hypothetical protein
MDATARSERMYKWVVGELQGYGGPKRGVTWSDGRDLMAVCLSTVATNACIRRHDAAFVDPPVYSPDQCNGRFSTLCKA